MSPDTRPRHAMSWMTTLAEMMRQGTRLARRCSRCDTWEPLDVVEVALALGEETNMFDRKEPCPVCGGHRYYCGSPGEGTPFRPLRS